MCISASDEVWAIGSYLTRRGSALLSLSCLLHLLCQFDRTLLETQGRPGVIDESDTGLLIIMVPPPPLDILSLKSPISAYYKTITTLSGQKRVFFIYIYDLLFTISCEIIIVNV